MRLSRLITTTAACVVAFSTAIASASEEMYTLGACQEEALCFRSLYDKNQHQLRSKVFWYNWKQEAKTGSCQRSCLTPPDGPYPLPVTNQAQKQKLQRVRMQRLPV